MSLQKKGDRGIRKTSVPNIVGVARSTYQTTLTNAGLTYTESSQTTSDSSLDQKCVSQGTASDTGLNL